jgi:hypothetical protein
VQPNVTPPNAGDPVPAGDQAIVEEVVPSCVLCQLGLACPLFTNAARRMEKQYNQSCGKQAPTGELDDRATPTLVRFTDHSGLNGTGNPSGGPYPARGFLYYKKMPPPGGSTTARVTCAVADPLNVLCDAILADAQRRIT